MDTPLNLQNKLENGVLICVTLQSALWPLSSSSWEMKLSPNFSSGLVIMLPTTFGVIPKKNRWILRKDLPILQSNFLVIRTSSFIRYRATMTHGPAMCKTSLIPMLTGPFLVLPRIGPLGWTPMPSRSTKSTATILWSLDLKMEPQSAKQEWSPLTRKHAIWAIFIWWKTGTILESISPGLKRNSLTLKQKVAKHWLSLTSLQLRSAYMLGDIDLEGWWIGFNTSWDFPC